MNKLNIELTNCFGIDSLNHDLILEKAIHFLYMQEMVL